MESSGRLEELGVGLALKGVGVFAGEGFEDGLGGLLGGDAGGFEKVGEGRGAGLAGFVGGPGCVVDEAEGSAVGSEAEVGIIDAEVEAELGAR